MEAPMFGRGGRGRGGIVHDGRGRPQSRNKYWSSTSHTSADSERWERGGHRGGGRGRGPRGTIPKFQNASLRLNNVAPQPTLQDTVEPNPHLEEFHENEYGEEIVNEDYDMDSEGGDGSGHLIQEPELETQEERDKFFQELVKAREIERKTAIAEGKMDDPLVPKRLEDAINIVGTCMDMCPRFERHRRERENNLFEWEMIPGTKRVDHNRAVKMYERGAGDRILPSDLRPPKVLKRTLDYLFHDLLPRGGFSPTFNFIRDRSRAVRNDFTMQHMTGPLAIECHDRCARFHILALHFQKDVPGFSVPLEEQQLMNTLQSLKEFYEDQRGKYQSPTELEMRVYHRLVHIRDQRERHDDIPKQILTHPVFQLTTEFRHHVQKNSAPITKTSKLVVTEEGMQIFSQLAGVLNDQGSTVMVYLVACILERLFGKDTIEDIETIRSDLTLPEIIDGVSTSSHFEEIHSGAVQTEGGKVVKSGLDRYELGRDESQTHTIAPAPLKPTSAPWLSSDMAEKSSSISVPTVSSTASATPATGNAFAGLVSNAFGATNVFGPSFFSVSSAEPAVSAFHEPIASSQNFFAGRTFTTPTPSVQPSSTVFPDPAINQPSDFPTFISNSAPASQSSSNNVSSSTAAVNNVAPLYSSASSTKIGNLAVNGSSVSFSTSLLNPKAPEFAPSNTSAPSRLSQTFPAPTSDAVSAHDVRTVDNIASTQITTDFQPSLNSLTAPPTAQQTLSFKEIPPTSTSATPQLIRLTAPPLLKINTNSSVDSYSKSSSASPRVPHTPRIQPISLPSTPNTQPPNLFLDHLRSALEPRGSISWNSSQEILSPLVIGTPIAGSSKPLNNFTPLSTPQTSGIFQSAPLSKMNGKEKAANRLIYHDIEEVEEMKKKAVLFSQRSLLIKEIFGRWLKRAIGRAAWHEACRHGDEYRQRLTNQNHSRQSLARSLSRTEIPPDKQRKLLTNGFSPSPPRKRARKRVSTEYRLPRTDAELAERFKENQKEHEQRWAQGSFLNVIRKHIQDVSPSTLALPWDIWLSLNPGSDATAIWLERKFDMPNSGYWVSENVFSIPLSTSMASKKPGYPGMILFECTPQNDVDELENKYRVLDDCSRLRAVINTLSPRRHFIPSLLLIHWAEDDSSMPSDFLDMVKQLGYDSTIQTHHIFAITAATKDLDTRLQTTLSTLSLDTDGRLVKSLTSKSFFKVFEPPFGSFLDEWMVCCNDNGRTNWNLYGMVIQVSISLLNIISHFAHSVLENALPQDGLPPFDPGKLVDSESTYDHVMEWLSGISSRDDARIIAMNVLSYRNIGQEFPMRIFIEHLHELIQSRFELLYPNPSSARPVLASDINSSLRSFKEEIQPLHMKLLQAYNLSVRRSPKRRSYSLSSSEQNSPETKRPRLSPSVASVARDNSSTPLASLNGDQMLSPTTSTVSLALTEGPTVTVAMLRALTNDVRRRYID